MFFLYTCLLLFFSLFFFSVFFSHHPHTHTKSHEYHQRITTDVSQRHLLPLETLLAALRVYGTEMGLDELECIIANLIYQGNIKGNSEKKKIYQNNKPRFPLACLCFFVVVVLIVCFACCVCVYIRMCVLLPLFFIWLIYRLYSTSTMYCIK